MPGRKGLFHIVEIVIISIIMFVILSQLSYSTGTGPDWGKSKLMTQGRDSLFSMFESGIDWTDNGEVTDYLDYVFNESHVKYRLELLGAPKENIAAGCLCDGSPGCTDFCDMIKGIIETRGTMSFNNMDVEFTAVETSNINTLFDVIVTNMSLAGQDPYIRNYLVEDRGLVLVRDLSDQDFADFGTILLDYFSIENSLVGGSGDVTFDLLEIEQEPEYYGMPLYFSVIENASGDRYNITHVFDAFASDSIKKETGPYGRVMLKTSSGLPACIAKESAWESSGKTAWLSRSSGDDWEILLTSLMIWSSEHRRTITDEGLSFETAKASMFVLPSDTSRDDYMLQPIEAVLSMGYIYR
jgi:hypothetical protein